MEWIIQNWLPLAIGVAFLILMRRGGMCCGGHRHQSRDSTSDHKTKGTAQSGE